MDQMTSIKALLTPVLESMNLRLYDCTWRQEGNTRILQVAIMRPDGTMDIDTCADASEHISQILDEKDLIAHEYFLEVCSPGAERELRSEEEIEQAVGEFIYIKFKDPKAGLDEVKGTLVSNHEDHVHLTYMDKAVKKKIDVEKANIAYIRLSVKI